MAIVDVTEYSNLAMDSTGGAVPAGLEPSTRNQQLSPDDGVVVSQPLRETTRFVRIHTDSVIRVKFGAGDEADETCMRMAAGQTEFFGLRAGQLTVSVISSI
jgi:hypothetical protein